MASDCAHEDSWFSREVCPEPCGQMHYYCANTQCGALLDPCPVLGELPPAPDGICVACETAPATTTCGIAAHPCGLCRECRLSLDGLEYLEDQTPAGGARHAETAELGRSESAPTPHIVPPAGPPCEDSAAG